MLYIQSIFLMFTIQTKPNMKNFLLTFFCLSGIIHTTNAQNIFSREGVTVPTLEINLYARAMNGSMFLADGVLQNFNNNYSAAVDNMDVRKFMNATDNLAIKNGDYNLIVERRPNICTTDTLVLMLTGTRVAPYRFEIDPSVLNYSGIKAFMIDKFLKTEIPVSLTSVTSISFNITTDAQSRMANRFMMIYRMQDPVRFTSIKAVRKMDNSISTTFQTENENNVNSYVVEKSNDGVNFEPVASQMPTANNFGNPYYSYIDMHANMDVQWYRVKANPINGTAVYSMVVKADKGIVKAPMSISVYPNPVSGGIINIDFTEQPFGLYKILVIDSRGQVLHSENVNLQKDNLQMKMGVAGLTSGIYRILLVDAAGNKSVKTIVAK